MIAQELKEFADKIQMPLLRRATALRNTAEEYYVMEALPFVVAKLFEEKFDERIRVSMIYNEDAFQDDLCKGIQYRKMWVGIISFEDPNTGIFFIDVNNIERVNPNYWDPVVQTDVFHDLDSMIPHSAFYTYHESSLYHTSGYTIGTLGKRASGPYVVRPINSDLIRMDASYSGTDIFGAYIILTIEQTRMIDSIFDQFQYLIHI